ncbi:MAG: hypothetical protein ACOYUZ_04020 [Patescibacteria group bacterium]
MPKLLAIAAGSFAIAVLSVYVLIWHLASFPVAQNNAVSAVLPAQSSLDLDAPDVWRQVAKNNKYFPTYAGLAKDINGELRAYAVRFSLLSIITEGKGPWIIEGVNMNEFIRQRSSAYKELGPVWKKTVNTKLNMNLQEVFGDAGDELALPRSVQGELEDHVWRTDMNVADLQYISFANAEKSAVSLDGNATEIVETFLMQSGYDLDLANKGVISWEAVSSSLAVDYVPSTRQADDLIGIAAGADMVEEKEFELEDGDVVKRIYRIDRFTTSTDVNELMSGVKGLVVDSDISLIGRESVRTLTCPGKQIALFDAASINNICSWTDICFWDIKQIQISIENEKVIFCYF